jgi:hypothetical protein
MTQLRAIRHATIAVLAGALLAATFAPAAGAASATYYVDGKTGSDSNNGLSASSAFKTIAKAASRLPAGSAAAGSKVIVKGYTDYLYRERPIPSQFASAGTASAPVVFQAAGYVPGSAGSYVKPIVVGSDKAPASGKSWTASSTKGVWYTPWATAPYFFGVTSGNLRTALFQNGSSWLWEQSSLSALGTRAKTGLGGYWWDKAKKLLYVSALRPGGTAPSPAGYSIDVIVRPTFYFKGTQGVRYVQVRGFEVRHSANGIAFDDGTDYSVAADNVLNGNFLMGATTAGVQTSSGPNAAVGNTISRNSGAYNTLQLIKIDEGTTSGTFCDNVTHHNGLRGIFVQGDAPGSTGYTGGTSGVLICRNRVYSHTYNPTGSVYNNASGITVANEAKNVTLDSNDSYGNDVGIHVVQERDGLTAMSGIVLKNNLVHNNRRFGLNIYDGVYGDGAGSLSVTGDMYWGNGIGVMVSQGSTNKSLNKVTIHGNYADGIRVGASSKPKASLKVTRSIITNNGGYGLWLVTGSSASVSYTSFSGNKLGSTKSTKWLTKTYINTKPAGYMTTTPAGSNFLRIAKSSYQYTAGPTKTPIGARY